MPSAAKERESTHLKVRDVMSGQPVEFPGSATASDAARAMRDKDIGAVVVVDNGSLRGIVTDRDIAIRAVADGKDPNRVRLDEICSKDLISLSPDETIEKAVSIMKHRAIRRLPVVERDAKPVGIVSLGDLAVRLDRSSALGEISSARPNH